MQPNVLPTIPPVRRVVSPTHRKIKLAPLSVLTRKLAPSSSTQKETALKPKHNFIVSLHSAVRDSFSDANSSVRDDSGTPLATSRINAYERNERKTESRRSVFRLVARMPKHKPAIVAMNRPKYQKVDAKDWFAPTTEFREAPRIILKTNELSLSESRD